MDQEKIGKFIAAGRKEKGLTQISLTDSDSKLMKTRNGFSMSYNVQTAVDSKTHLIKDFKVTDRPSDFGLLSETIDRTKNEKADEVVEVVADKGYECPEDMVECLEKGVLPNVISKNSKQGYELETKYEAAEIDEMTIKSRILTIRLAEKLDRKPSYSEQLGLNVRLRRSGTYDLDEITGTDCKAADRAKMMKGGK